MACVEGASETKRLIVRVHRDQSGSRIFFHFFFRFFFLQIKKFALVAKTCLEKTVNFVVKIITDNIFNEKVLLYNFKFYLFLLTH